MLAFLLALLCLLLPVLVIAWIPPWRREMRERLTHVQARLDGIENHLLQQRDQTRG